MPPSDTLDAVLSIAAEVIDENSPDPQGTRIERLAQWLAKNVGGEPDAVPSLVRRLTEIIPVPANDVVVWRGVMSHFAMTPNEAREFAVALLRAAEGVES